ncbi:MAG: hypothetical protein E8D41_02845 [Nitrospira sp.]|nr:MAG: hypothetical protein E8D41_02845 [Nitrospira sp.]
MVDEQLAGGTPTSQFGRALSELEVELIPAHSPQAKGRVERLFHTFQDRVIKEMRLADVSTLDAANQFLKGYLPIYNRRVAVQPAQVVDLHRPRPASRELDRILCLKTLRCLRKDFTIVHQRGLYQIRETIQTPHVLGAEHVDGTLRITHQGRPLAFYAITSRPMKAAAKTVHRLRCPVTPRPDHPWRKRLLPEGTKHAAAGLT